MNTDLISAELRHTAASWHVPALDGLVIRDLAEKRRLRHRRRTVISALVVLMIAGAGTAAVSSWPSDHRIPSAPPGGAHSRSHLSQALAPGGPPTVVIRPIRSTGQRVAGELVLARIPAGTSASVHARLSFRSHATGRVRNTAVVVCRPGTEPAATSQRTTPGTGNYYSSRRVAISPMVNATAPHTRTITVSTPTNLPPGTYPVLTDIRTALLGGQRPGNDGPYDITSEIGVIVVTRH